MLYSRLKQCHVRLPINNNVWEKKYFARKERQRVLRLLNRVHHDLEFSEAFFIFCLPHIFVASSQSHVWIPWADSIAAGCRMSIYSGFHLYLCIAQLNSSVCKISVCFSWREREKKREERKRKKRCNQCHHRRARDNLLWRLEILIVFFFIAKTSNEILLRIFRVSRNYLFIVIGVLNVCHVFGWPVVTIQPNLSTIHFLVEIVDTLPLAYVCVCLVSTLYIYHWQRSKIQIRPHTHKHTHTSKSSTCFLLFSAFSFFVLFWINEFGAF